MNYNGEFNYIQFLTGELDFFNREDWLNYLNEIIPWLNYARKEIYGNYHEFFTKAYYCAKTIKVNIENEKDEKEYKTTVDSFKYNMNIIRAKGYVIIIGLGIVIDEKFIAGNIQNERQSGGSDR